MMQTVREKEKRDDRPSAAWMQTLLLVWIVCWAGMPHACSAQESARHHATAGEKPMSRLPTPHFHPQPDDPPWLEKAVQFHGHLGPWAAAGLRMGIGAREAVGAHGYFDLEVEALGPLDRPPRSCLLDGLQVSTGATLGKRNLRWVDSDELVVRVRNLKTGAVAEVRPTERLLAWLGTVGSARHEHVESDEHRPARSGAKSAPASRKPSSPAPQPASTAGAPANQAALEATARRIIAAAQSDILAIRVIAPAGQPAGK